MAQGFAVYNGIVFKTYQEIIDYMTAHPDEADAVINSIADPIAKGHIQGLWKVQKAALDMQNGEGSANDVLGALSDANVQYGPETEKYLDNLISRENTEAAQNYQTEMRDTSLLSAADQLSSLGLSTSNIIQTGGASLGNVASAASSHHSVASLRQQERINKFNQQMGLAKSLIGAAGSMASSGIYGHALGAIKNSAQKVAASAANSGLGALKSFTIADAKKQFNLSDTGGSFAGDNSNFF